MFASLVFLAAVHVASATTVSLFPEEFGPSNGLQGEIVGTGGSVGTTFVLSGAESGIPFTLTIAEDASQLAETVNIPTLSLEFAAGCVVTAGATDAICQNVIHEEGMTITQTVTAAFSPFAVVVSTSGVTASSTPTSASGSGSGSGSGVATSVTSTTVISTSVASATSAGGSATSASASILSSLTPSVSQSTISPSTSSSATLTSPSTSASATSDATAARKLNGVTTMISLGLIMLAIV